MARLIPIVSEELLALFTKLPVPDIIELTDAHWAPTDMLSLKRGREETLLDMAGPSDDVYYAVLHAEHRYPVADVYFLASSEEEVRARFAVHEVMLL